MTPSIVFRSPPHHVPADTVRLLHEDDLLLVALSVGTEGFFSAYWAPASRFILDLCEEAWRAATGSPAERLAALFPHVRSGFAAGAAARFDRPPAEIADAQPGGQLFVAAITRDEVHAAWQGRDVAFLVRSGAPIGRTTPHAFREDLARRDPTLPSTALAEAPDVCTRMIDSAEPPSTASFRVLPGDVLVIASRATEPMTTELARALAEPTDPASAAARLAAIAFADDPPFYGHVAVARL